MARGLGPIPSPAPDRAAAGRQDHPPAYDGRLWPVEIKKAALVREADTTAFRTLAGRGIRTGHGAVVCLSPERMPLNREVDVIPVGWV
ncbi:MAG: hypothetical protein WCT12_02075 [Verrucomicrobiota bacterium]